MPGLRGNLFDLYQRANIGMPSSPAYGVPQFQIPDTPPPMPAPDQQQHVTPPSPAGMPPMTDRFARSYGEVVQQLQPKERAAYAAYQQGHPGQDFAQGLPPIEPEGGVSKFFSRMGGATRDRLSPETAHGMDVYKQRVLNAIAQEEAEEQAAEAALKQRRMALDEGNAPWEHMGQTRQLLDSPGFVAPEGGVPIGEAMRYSGLPAPQGALGQSRFSREIAAGKEQAARSGAEVDASLRRQREEIPIDKQKETELGPIKASNAGREESARTGARIDTEYGRRDKIGDIATAREAPKLAREKALAEFKKGLEKDVEPRDKNAAGRILRRLSKDPQTRLDSLDYLREQVVSGAMPGLAANKDAMAELAAERSTMRRQLARGEAMRAPKAE